MNWSLIVKTIIGLAVAYGFYLERGTVFRAVAGFTMVYVIFLWFDRKNP